MNRIPVWIDGEITLSALKRIFEAEGYHLRLDGAGRVLVDPVPLCVRKDVPNVIPLRRLKTLEK